MRRLWSRINLRPSWVGLTLLLIFGLAAFFRVYGLGGRDLWTDEAWVALAALESTPQAALAAGHSTPPLYILTVWALAQVVGSSEAVLRSLSFFFGLGTLALFWPLARALTSRSGSLLGLAMVAFSPIMVYYAKELKQYSGDAFFAVLVFFLVERLRLQDRKWAWAALAVAGTLGLGFSHTQIFILPVAWATLWFILPSGQRLKVALLGGVWAAAFAAGYFLVLRGQVDPELLAYWAQDFPDSSGIAAFVGWLGAAFSRYFRYFFGEWGLFWGLPLLLAGILVLIRQGCCRACFYLGGPLLLALGAASLHRYPFMAHYGGNRLMLFSAPLLYLVAAVGLMLILTRLWEKRQKVLALGLTGFLVLALNPLGVIKENLYPSNNREEIQPLVAHLQSQLQPQDWVYVYYFAVYPFKYYFHRPWKKVCWGKSCVETDLVVPAAKSQHPRRLWLVASHFPSLNYMREFAGELLGSQWRETACLSRASAALFCFEWQGPQLAKSRTFPAKPGESGSPTPPAGTAYK
ncbi:MAG: glycosyltransferase family 39 protein [Deltaproteobacteria bacterium]|nr:glycosyltransferase family 39 protein [Deltaproteobacteria bacterium]